MESISPSVLAVGAAGMAAGVAIALPLGAVGVLVIRRGVVAGWRPAAAAAGGVALVDTVYCALAVLLGASIAPVIDAWGAWPRIVGGVVLIVLGARSLLRAVRPTPRVVLAAPGVDGALITARRSLAEFVGLTAINPLTLLYFAGVAAALGGALGNPIDALVFTAGVGLASLGWQLVLAAVGSHLGRGLGPRGVLGLSIAGAGIVLVLGIAALATAVPDVWDVGTAV
ncbi:MAG TPA: LysE family transporter [Plantibacter sp.]|uniref:LysE family transporter n=1 Tax=unclassified Plantibacter TaxID=2624265 RepID=UPI002B5C6F6A|nr:LysE family transporter [Plantibacter sp.]